MKHSHRNGETKKPKIEGLFWVKEGDEKPGIVEIVWQRRIPATTLSYGHKIAATPAHFIVWVIGSEVDVQLDQFSDDAQWWGPLIPPQD